jgi:hypothetical protein
MPATYFSATGALSFDAVAPRDQAVGPIPVIISPSAPDEIIEPVQDENLRIFRRPPIMFAIAALTAVATLVIAGAVS